MKKLKELRKEKKLTRQYVAKKLCISVDALRMYEGGWRTPPLHMAIKIAKFYEKSVEEIFDE